MKLVSITKVAKDSGIHPDSIKKMIRENKIIGYKQENFRNIMIDFDEFQGTFKPINNITEEFDLSIFEI